MDVPTERPVAAEASRYPYLDRIKVTFIVVIIVVHGVLGYATVKDVWTYQGRREATLSAEADAAIMAAVIVGLLFVMALFFFMAGLLTPRSLDRRGPGPYAVDRLLRLGMPFILWVLVIWPVTVWGMDVLTGYSYRSVWESFTQAQPFPDTGPMWFIEVLLIYSLAYAGMVALRHAPSPSVSTGARRTITPGLLVSIALATALVTFAVRQIFSISSNQFAHLNAWQWPAYIALFSLGIAAGRRGWQASVPRSLTRTAGVLGLVGLSLALGVVVLLGMEVVALEDVAGGWSLPVAGISLAEGLLSVGASVWLVGFAQRHWNSPSGEFQRSMARSAYGAFVLQGVVLIAAALTVRPLSIAAEGKGVIVGALGVAGSFGLAWLLAIKTPLGRVL